MCYENEFCIDQWHHVDDHKEEFGTTSFKEFDETERKDGGDRNEVPDLDGGIIGGLQDDADRDYAKQYKFIYEKISDRLYEAAANVLRHTKLSIPTAKEVAADAIRREVAECKTDYDFHEYDELTEYNLDAALTDYELDLI